MTIVDLFRRHAWIVRRLTFLVWAIISGAAQLVSAQTIAFPDASLEAAVQSALGPGPITVAEMQTLTNFTANGDGITNATGLQYATNLVQLDLSGNALTDISPLAGLSIWTFQTMS